MQIIPHEPPLKGNESPALVITFTTFILGHKKGLYLLLGNYLYFKKKITCSPVFFAHARIEAESTAWDKANIKEVGLVNIYKELAFILLLENKDWYEIMKLECKLEWMLMKKCDHLNASSISSPTLEKKNIKLYGEYHLESPEHKEAYDQASFFTTFFETKEIELPALETIENEPFNKYNSAVETVEINATRFEGILENNIWDTRGLSSAMVGASKAERIRMNGDDSKKKILIEIATGVIAPTLVGYTLWVIKRALDLGLKKLVFFSSNGLFLYNIAELLKFRLQLPLDLHLLQENEEHFGSPFFKGKDLYDYGFMETFEKESDKAFFNKIHTNGNSNPVIFYFSIEDKNDQLLLKKEGYFWDAKKNIGYKNVLTNIYSVIEPFFLPQKSLEKKLNSNGITAPSKEAILQDHSFYGDEKIIFDAVTGFTKNLFLSIPFIFPYTDLRGTISNLINSFARSPSTAEVRVWNSFLNKGNSELHAGNRAAKAYQIKDLLKILVQNNKYVHENSWHEGSLSLTPKPLKKLVVISSKISNRVQKIMKKRVKV